MAVINVKAVTKLVATNPVTRKAFTFGIQFLLYLLEAQKLVDSRKLQEVSLDWERGTINVGDDFLAQVASRAVSEYYINRIKFESQTNFKHKLNSKLAETKDLSMPRK